MRLNCDTIVKLELQSVARASWLDFFFEGLVRAPPLSLSLSLSLSLAMQLLMTLKRYFKKANC
jgi:hypothetical protein